jgi:hypothetical protein
MPGSLMPPPSPARIGPMVTESRRIRSSQRVGRRRVGREKGPWGSMLIHGSPGDRGIRGVAGDPARIVARITAAFGGQRAHPRMAELLRSWPQMAVIRSAL